ncbi:hypothetical protein LCGC14_1988090 [marine sediment metagenome]|uniref:Nuclease associated modular domain-containing protein n=1 Tax=marine sediment metagenome TaxID=412755 RepID=A0A0F9HK86_9ZZZZ
MSINVSDYGLIPHKTIAVSIGQVYGRLNVIGIGKKESNKRAYIIVQCSCGSPPKAIEMNNLRAGKSKSCGCIIKEMKTTHGSAKHPLYFRWRNMIDRCESPQSCNYHRYGARGIKVCERWHNIQNFIKDMYPTYRKYLEIERLDNEGNYEPNNCIWGSRSQQALNRRTNHKITFEGRTMTISEWAREKGIKYNCLSDRILNQKLSPKEALTRKVLTIEESTKNALATRWAKYRE